MQGNIKFYNSEQGFGFIIPEDGSGDVFFHVTQIEETWEPKEGDFVTFELETGRDGRITAINVGPTGEKMKETIERIWKPIDEKGITILIDQGSAPNDVIVDILSDISILYRLTGGSGIDFRLENILNSNFVEA